MHMEFWWGTDIGDFLFSGLSVHTVGAFVLTCVLLAIISMIFEGMKTLETKIRRDHHKRMRQAMLGRCAEERSNLLGDNSLPTPGPSSQNVTSSDVSSRWRRGCLVMLRQVSMYTTNTSLNYIIMLIIMLFNGYLAVAIIIGTTIGYYIFGHISVKYNIQSVQEKMQVAVVCVPECEGGGNESTPPLGQGSTCSSNPDGGLCEKSRSQSPEPSSNKKLLIKCAGGGCMKASVECCCSGKKTSDTSMIKKSEPVQEDCESKLLETDEPAGKCCKRKNENEDSSRGSEEKTSL